MAVLFDDDWWMDYHLENALEGFTIHPDAIASFGACLWTTGEEGYLTEAYGSFLPWFVAGRPPVNHRWLLDLADLLVAGMISTGFHYSSLVVDRDVYIKSLDCVANGNPYDTDRAISVELARHGKVICHSLPQVYIRTHKQREATTMVDNIGEKWWGITTDNLFALAKSENIDLKHEVSSRMAARSISVNELKKHFGQNSFEGMLKRGIFDATTSSASATNERFPAIREIYRGVVPPFLRTAINEWRNRSL
jgi:hypothetical protein